jgi:predicted acetyltransferase
MTADYLDAPVDGRSREKLAGRGLDLRSVPAADEAGAGAWHQSVARGFLDSERTPEQLAVVSDRGSARRRTGVFDAAGVMPERPVGTISSWATELTVPGGGVLPSWAISSVTVAPTHRRRGIARAMMEGELRTAVRLGLPIASLTVTESTLYGRYGFGPAADSAAWRLDVKRAGWIGPEPAGRLDFIPRERLRALAPEVHERTRRRWPGEAVVPPWQWDGLAGTRPDLPDAAAVRAVQWTDAAGVVRGLLAYRVQENADHFARSTATVSYLLAEDDDAYAALWRFLLELDSIAEVQARELSVAEPLRWMIADQRAATITVQEHHYLRILDVPAALRARAYDGPGALALEITDPIGLAAGRWILRVAPDGSAAIDPWTESEPPADAVTVELGVAELSSLYLGSVSFATLADAGRVRASDPRAVARVFGWHVPARLSFWY